MEIILRHSTKPGRLAATALVAALCLSCQERPDSWESHWEKGNLSYQQRDFIKAEAELKTALKLAETRDTQDPKVTRSIVGLGMIYDAQRRFDEAQQQFERALHLTENTHGADHPDLIMPLNYLGALHGIQHHFPIALLNFERALKIQERNLGPTQSLTSKHIKYVAALHASRAQYQEAEAFLSRVLELQKPSSVQTDKTTADYLDNYNRLHTAQEEYNKAKPYLDEFDPVDGGQLPQNLDESNASLARLTNLLATQDKLEKAEGLLRRAAEETEKAQGPKGIQLARRLSELADLYWAWDKLDIAIPLLERSLSMIGASGTKEGSKPRPYPHAITPVQNDNQLAEAGAPQRHLAALRRANQATLQKASIQ